MQDAAPVRRLDRAHNLQRQTYRLFDGHRPVQRLAVDIFEHEVARADVMELTDVWVVQRSNRPRFVLEATQTVGVSGECVGKDLDRHVTLEAGIARPIDLTHPARPDGE